MSDTIVSLALLQATWETRRQDYLDAFVPMVAEVIRFRSFPVAAEADVREAVWQEFALDIPSHVIAVLLERCRKAGYLRRENRILRAEPKRLAELTFGETRDRTLAMVEELATGAVRYVAETYGANWSTAAAKTALTRLAHDRFLDRLGVKVRRQTAPGSTGQPNDEFFAAKFLTYLHQTEHALLKHVERIAEGSVLASAIYLDAVTVDERRFRKTEVYLDTECLIHLLGLEGEVREQTAEDLRALLVAARAGVRCFRHTVVELESILCRISRQMAGHQATDGSPQTTLDYLVASGWRIHEVNRLCNRLDKELAALQIHVRETPEFVELHSINESDLRAAAKADGLHRDRPLALDHDIKSVVSVAQLRRGKMSTRVEDCGAVFVTNNTQLARIARQFFSVEHPRVVPPCVTSAYLTVVLWLKSATERPNLPLERLAADCHAALQPGPDLWKALDRELARLHSDGRLTEEECFLARHDLSTGTHLMELTYGQAENLTAGRALQLWERVLAERTVVHREETAGLQQIIQQQSEEIADSEHRVQSAVDDLHETRRWVKEQQRERAERRLARLKTRSEEQAGAEFQKLLVGGVGLTVVLLVCQFLPQSLLPGRLQQLAGALGVIWNGLGWASFAIGFSLTGSLTRWRQRRQEALFTSLASLLDDDESDEAHLGDTAAVTVINGAPGEKTSESGLDAP